MIIELDFLTVYRPSGLTAKRQIANRMADKATYSDVAVVIPCLNEAAAIEHVVKGFGGHLPGARIYVFDNGSSDDTAAIAKRAGAIVRAEPRCGKGHVMRRMFRDVEAAIYVLVDGDLTYDAAAAKDMIERLRKERLDVVIASRVAAGADEYRPGHKFGNWALTATISRLFKAPLRDMLSGYRVMSRRFVKSFPMDASGFEIETEMTVHMLQLDVPFIELDIPYSSRGENSESKLNTWQDGFRILRTILGLMVLERPVAIFGGFGLICIVIAGLMFQPVLAQYQVTGLVPRFPTLIVSVAFALIGLISCFSGLILSGITRTRRDMKRLAYLAAPAPETYDS